MSLWELTNAPLTPQVHSPLKITLGEGRQMHGKKELCIFLPKAEINVHMCFLSSMGRRQLRQQRIYWCSTAMDWLSCPTDPTSY